LNDIDGSSKREQYFKYRGAYGLFEKKCNGRLLKAAFGPDSVWLVCAVCHCGFNQRYGIRKYSRSRLPTTTTLSGLLRRRGRNPTESGPNGATNVRYANQTRGEVPWSTGRHRVVIEYSVGAVKGGTRPLCSPKRSKSAFLKPKTIRIDQNPVLRG
jgi:hypothetical protein